MNELLSQKINLRKILTHKRDLIKKNSSIEFNVKVFEELNKYINFKEIPNIASFISIRSEISTHKLNKKIMSLGKILSFPVIKRNSTELIFKGCGWAISTLNALANHIDPDNPYWTDVKLEV